MRSTSAPKKPYTVEYTPAAWQHIGSLAWDEFSALQKALNRIAEVAAAALPAAPPAGALLDAHIAGLDFRYAVESATRVVRLVDLARQARRPARARTGT